MQKETVAYRMLHSAVWIVRDFFLGVLALILFGIWGFGTRTIVDPWDRLHTRFYWIPDSSGRLGFLLWLAYACLSAAALVMLFNFVRLLSAPKGTRRKITLASLLWPERSVVPKHKAPSVEGQIPVVNSEGPKALETLVGFVPIESPADQFFWWWPASFLLLVFGEIAYGFTFFIVLFAAWLIAVFIWPPCTLIVDCVAVLLLFRWYSGRYKTFADRLEAFVFGPAISFKRSVQLGIGMAGVAGSVLIAALAEVRGWSHFLPPEADKDYAIWQNFFGDVRFPDFLRESIVIVVTTFALLEIMRQLPMVRSVVQDYRIRKKLPVITWQNYVPDLKTDAQGFVLCHITDIHFNPTRR